MQNFLENVERVHVLYLKSLFSSFMDSLAVLTLRRLNPPFWPTPLSLSSEVSPSSLSRVTGGTIKIDFGLAAAAHRTISDRCDSEERRSMINS